MKRWLLVAVMLGIMLYAVSASAFTFGRDVQPVSVVGSVTTTGSASAKQVVQGGSSTDTPVYVQGAVTATMSDVTLADTIIDLALTDTATVYNVVLPAKCVAYEFQARGAGVVIWSLTSTTVATNYMTLKSGYPYNTFGLGSEKLYTGTIYFKCPLTAAEVVEIRIFTKP